MAEEEFNPIKEGRRIVAQYLSKRGWAREWRRTTFRQLYPGVEREAFEAKQREIDHLEDEAEEFLSTEVEKWRHDPSPQAKEVLRTILQLLGKRTDLGFFAKRIVEHLRHQLEF